MKTQAEVRESFWATFPEFEGVRRSNKRQNDYPADVRMSFVDYVEALSRDGQISEKLAAIVTL